MTPTCDTGSEDGVAPFPDDVAPLPDDAAPLPPAEGAGSSSLVTKSGPKTTPEGISVVVTTPMLRTERRRKRWRGRGVGVGEVGKYRWVEMEAVGR